MDQTDPFPVWILYQLPIRMSVSPQHHIHEWCQLPGSFTE